MSLVAIAGIVLFVVGVTIVACADGIRSRRVIMAGAIAENVGFIICLVVCIVGAIRLIAQ